MAAKTEAEKKEYNQQYYQLKREDINLRRRRRYHQELSHRQKLQTISRERYRKENKGRNKNAGYTLKKVDGHQLFTIQYVEQVTGKTQAFIRDWERKGLIPKSTYVDVRGWRLYTEPQIKLIGTAIQNYKTGAWSRDKIKAYLGSQWLQ